MLVKLLIGEITIFIGEIWLTYVNFLIFSGQIHMFFSHSISHGIKQLSSDSSELVTGNAKMGDGGAEAIAKGLNRGPKAIVWLQLQD